MPEWRRELRDRVAELRVAPEDEAEIVEELAQHLDDEFAELAPRVGAAAAERQLLARLDAGALADVTRARRRVTRQARRRRVADALSPHRAIADLRVAVRRARRHVAFTSVAVLSLALGIGANTAVFSLVDALLLRRPAVAHPEQIVELYQRQPSFPFAPFSYPDAVALRTALPGVFSRLSLAEFAPVPRDMGDHVETLFTELVNGDYFPLLGLAPQAGRLLGAEDDVAAGAHPVVVLSDDYWHRAFGGDRTVVGRAIRLGGREYTIVGIAPKSYAGTVPGIVPALFVPIRMINQLQPSAGDLLADRDNHSLFLKVRLAPGVSVSRVRALAATFTSDMVQRYPTSWPGATKVVVVPENEIAVNPIVDGVVVPAAWTLMVVVALVLFVACANLASFLLAQGRDRQREIAIRIALGASRASLVRQLLSEALFLAALGGIAGVLVARAALAVLMRANLPVPIPITIGLELDGRVLAFALLVAAISAVLIGLLPALQATRPNVVEVIKSENTGGGPARRVTVRSAIVVGQVAVSLVLLITATLFLRSLQERTRIDPGFGRAPAGMLWFTIPADRYAGPRRQQLLDKIEARVRQIDGVDAVGVIDNVLLNTTGTQTRLVNVAGFVPPRGEPGFGIDYAAADAGFFEAAGVQVVRGRTFSPADAASTPLVAVVNEVMASRFWPGTSPLGRTFRADSSTYRVIGVARDTKVRSLGEPPQPFFFVSLAQQPKFYVWLVARTRGDADAAAVEMIGALREIDPSLMVLKGTTMARHLATMMLPARLGAIAFALFAALALILSVIGVYGVVSYAVARRAREVGIRLALGADAGGVVRLLMREGMILVLAGGALGLSLALAVTRTLQSLLSGVTAADPLAFAVAPLILFGVGVLASLVPALRSIRTDPAAVMRAE